MPRSKTGEVIQKIKRGYFLLPHPVFTHYNILKQVINGTSYLCSSGVQKFAPPGVVVMPPPYALHGGNLQPL